MFAIASMSRLTRRALTVGTATVLALAPLRVAAAQDQLPEPSTATRPWGIRFTSGALVPTGAQRDAFSNAQLSGVGLSWRLLPSLDVTGGFSWARSRSEGLAARPKLDVFTSDLGLEMRTAAWSAGAMLTVRPFVGVGAGVRTYNSRVEDVDVTNHPAAYVALGGAVDLGRVGLRLEARNYGSRLAITQGSSSHALRNDVMISASLTIQKRRTAQP